MCRFERQNYGQNKESEFGKVIKVWWIIVFVSRVHGIRFIGISQKSTPKERNAASKGAQKITVKE